MSNLILCFFTFLFYLSLFVASFPINRGGVEDTRLEVKAKDTKKIRGQGQGQPFRGQTLSRTDPLEAKDRITRGQGQGPRTQAHAFSKKKSSKFFSGDLQLIGISRILIGGGLNYKSHEMTSSKFFQRGSFCGTKKSQNGRSEIVACLHVTRILQR